MTSVFVYRPAHADEPPAVSAPIAPSTWYGWQTLAADAAVSALWIGAHETGSSGLRSLGIAGYVAGTPLIHVLHGRSDNGLVSALLRVTAPVVGGAAGFLVGGTMCSHSNHSDELLFDYSISSCQVTGLLVGFFGAMVAVSVFDATQATVAPGDAWHPHRGGPPLAFAPTIVPTSDGATVGFVGRF